MALADIPVIYLVGAPRSGTTWLQLMLGSHSEIATPIELDFFSGFAQPWYDTWRQHREASANRPGRPEWGLPAALTEPEFEEALGLVVDRIYRSVLEAKPGATIMLEKDPRSSRLVGTILRTVPHARFIHLIRDGRDVACSTVRVSRSWAAGWAPERVEGAAELWQDCVRGARAAASAPGGYLELRYEELLGGAGPALLREALDFCGVADDAALAAELYERYRHGHHAGDVLSGGVTWAGEAARRGSDRSFPEGFIGAAAAGSWRAALSAAEREAFDSIAGDLLIELGYEPDHGWARNWTPLPARP